RAGALPLVVLRRRVRRSISVARASSTRESAGRFIKYVTLPARGVARCKLRLHARNVCVAVRVHMAAGTCLWAAAGERRMERDRHLKILGSSSTLGAASSAG